MKAALIRAIEGEIARATGRRYALGLEGLDEPALREVQRLLRDLDAEKRQAVSRARVTPWQG